MVVAGVEVTPDNTLKKLRTACEFLKVGKTLPSAYQSQLSHLWFFFFYHRDTHQGPHLASERPPLSFFFFLGKSLL